MLMAQEGSEASSSSFSPATNWWDQVHANPSSSSWLPTVHHHHPRWPPSNNSHVSGNDNMSIPTTSAPPLPVVENHMWSHLLLGSNSNNNGELQDRNVQSEDFVTEIFDPACDYLKKLESSWEFSPMGNMNKQMNSFMESGLIQHQHQGLSNLSDLVNNWSIAPPISTPMSNVITNPSIVHYPSSSSNIPHLKQGLGGRQSSRYLPPYIGNQEQEPISACPLGYQIGLNNSFIGITNNKYGMGTGTGIGMADPPPWPGTRSLSDLISFSGSLNKAPTTHKVPLRGLHPLEGKKHSFEASHSMRGGGVMNERKKKRAEDNSETLMKKSKPDTSNASNSELQAPKAKTGERITALQQMVSPFGKTDTASVLLEAIKYIRCLQEQIQLLSDPYMKSTANKDHSSWGGLDNDKNEENQDLRSKGLCLVPISCTPQVCRENNGPDYWTPTYRGCLYR